MLIIYLFFGSDVPRVEDVQQKLQDRFKKTDLGDVSPTTWECSSITSLAKIWHSAKVLILRKYSTDLRWLNINRSLFWRTLELPIPCSPMTEMLTKKNYQVVPVSYRVSHVSGYTYLLRYCLCSGSTHSILYSFTVSTQRFFKTPQKQSPHHRFSSFFPTSVWRVFIDGFKVRSFGFPPRFPIRFHMFFSPIGP